MSEQPDEAPALDDTHDGDQFAGEEEVEAEHDVDVDAFDEEEIEEEADV